jgi:hypothetical protein
MRDTDCFHISPDLVSLQLFTPTLYSEYSNNGRTIMPISSACMCWHLSSMHILIRVSWNEYYLRQTQKRLSKVMQTLANCKETWNFPLLIFIHFFNSLHASSSYLPPSREMMRCWSSRHLRLCLHSDRNIFNTLSFLETCFFLCIRVHTNGAHRRRKEISSHLSARQSYRYLKR